MSALADREVMIIKGNIVDIKKRQIFKGEIRVENEFIVSIEKMEHDVETYILPGFVDAHIHIESSMLVPSEFAKIAVNHGTVATVSDPHEIANVLGVDGVNFMIENGKQSPLKFNFGAPSCVPATSFESSGAIIDSNAVKRLLENPDIKYLAEMMNYPGVINGDEEVIKKVEWAKHFKKPIDGHAPGMVGDAISKYISAGISTDHECVTYDEALEKLQKGMKILIREGSAAKNFEALIDLLKQHSESIMFCSDDKHPDDLLLGHINELCRRAVAKGVNVYKVLRAACVNPVEHYDLDVGLLEVGDYADFIEVKDLNTFKVLKTVINGEVVSENGVSKLHPVSFTKPNNFNIKEKSVMDFKVSQSLDQKSSEASKIRVIEVLDGQLVTGEILTEAKIENGNVVSDIENDILKMAVVNRYSNEPPSVAFIKNFGLMEGAIASSVAHDSHNIIVVGVSDEMICRAVNLIINNHGGICAISAKKDEILALPIAGIISDQDAETVGKAYANLDNKAKEMGSKLKAPFMSLSFMALLVIPSLKLSDKGLFDGNKFQFVDLET